MKHAKKKHLRTKIAHLDKNSPDSFEHDLISYGFLKKMSRWISGEMTEIMNLSTEVKRYQSRLQG